VGDSVGKDCRCLGGKSCRRPGGPLGSRGQGGIFGGRRGGGWGFCGKLGWALGSGSPSGSWSQCGSLGCYAGVGGTTDPGPLAVGGASRWVALELVAMLRAPSRNASETALRVGLCKIPATIPVHSVNARKETTCRHLAKSRSRTLHGVDPPTCGWIRTDNHGTFEISDLGNHTTSTGIASDVAERTRSLAFACQDGRGWDS